MVQFVKKEVQQPASVQAQEEKKVKTFDEKYGTEILSASRAPRLAKFIDNEFSIFEGYRVIHFEENWAKYRNNFTAKYGPDFVPITGKSDVFVRRTRERVSTFRTKLLSLTQPLIGTPWSLTPSVLPRMILAGADPEAMKEQSEQAAKAQTTKIKDYLSDMKFKRTWHDTTLDICLYGAGVLRGPRERPARNPLPIRLAPDKWVAPSESLRPVIERVPLTRFYWDPQVDDLAYASACQVHWTFTPMQLRDLAKQGVLDAKQVEALIRNYPQGLYQPTQWERRLLRPIPTDARFTVIERWGVLPRELQEEWESLEKPEPTPESVAIEAAEQGEMALDPEGIEALEEEAGDSEASTGYVETWSCGPFVLRVNVDQFYEDSHPFTMIPLEKLPDSPCGQGAAEFVLDIQVIENALARALVDNVASSSMPITEWDMTQMIPGANLDVFPGKAIQKRPNDFSKGIPALQMHLTPNNSAQLVQAFQLFEGMVPTATSLPVAMTPGEMGSGMRSQGMQSDFFAMADTFMKLVAAEVDQNMFERVIGWLVDYINVYEPDPTLKGDLDVVAEGVSGAVKRELVAKSIVSMGELFIKIPGLDGWIDMAELATEVLPAAFGLDNPRIILNKDQKAQKDAYDDTRKAQAAAMQEHASQTAVRGIKAETSRADSLLQISTKADSMQNPAWGPITAESLAARGALTPQVAIGLKAWSDMMAQKLAQMNLPGDAQALSMMNYDPNQNPGQPGQDMGQPEMGQEPQLPQPMIDPQQVPLEMAEPAGMAGEMGME
jgi:hypothetical protein